RMATWKHYAILSLGDLARCRFEKKWIARRLNISEDEAEAAMNDLLALGLIKSAKGEFRRVSQPIRTKSDVPDKTIQQYHSQLMGKACESLERYDVKDRD